MTKFFNKFKKIHLWLIFEATNFQKRNQALSCTTPYGFLTQFRNLEKSSHAISRRCLDGQTLFHRTLQGGPISEVSTAGSGGLILMLIFFWLSHASLGHVQDTGLWLFK